jgi:hypothetical protein
VDTFTADFVYVVLGLLDALWRLLHFVDVLHSGTAGIVSTVLILAP